MHQSEKWKWSHSVVSDPQRPRGLQPSRLLHPGHFPGRSTGVGCHFLLQCVKVKVKSLSRVRPSATPWTATHQATPSMDFPGKSTGVGCHCLLRIGVLSDYLLLCSKLTSNRAAWNNRYFPRGLCESGFQAQLHWAFCSRSPARQQPMVISGQGWKSAPHMLSVGVGRTHILAAVVLALGQRPPSVLGLWTSGG